MSIHHSLKILPEFSNGGIFFLIFSRIFFSAMLTFGKEGVENGPSKIVHIAEF